MSQRFCTFVLDDHLYGVPVESVQEMLRPLAVTPVPLAAPGIVGLINLRGQIVPTVEARARLGLPARGAGVPAVCVVVRGRDGHAVSLVVDRVGDVLDLPDDLVEVPPETVTAEVRSLVTGVWKLPRGLLLSLDVESLVAVGGAAA